MILVNGKEVKQEHFPDNTLRLANIQSTDWSSQNAIWQFFASNRTITITWRYENDSELFTLMCLRDHFETNERVVLNIPYLPHARMDRVENTDEAFTLKTFCKAINNMNFSEVIVRDPHSNVSVALLDRLTVKKPDPYIAEAIVKTKEYINNRDFVMFYPDEGAMKRYKNLSTQFDDFFIPNGFAFGIKNRDWNTGKILNLRIENAEVVKGANVLIVDDICSKGGTFYYAAKALKEAGANKIFLYVTHCENTILEGEIFKSGLIEQVFTTRTLEHTKEVQEKIIYVD